MVIKVNDNGTLKSYQIPTGNPNWNSSQGEQGYIQNRPFYSESGYTELINETYSIEECYDAVNQLGEGFSGWYCAYVELPINIEEGKTYKVIFNETEYILNMESESEGLEKPNFFIGDNLNTITSPSELVYNFSIETDTKYNWTDFTIVTQDNTITNVDLEVYELEIIYHKLDSNYIDTENTIATQTYVDNAVSSAVGDIETLLASI